MKRIARQKICSKTLTPRTSKVSETLNHHFKIGIYLSYHIRIGPLMPLLCEIWPDIAEIESRSISLDLDQKVDYIGPPRLEIYLLSVGNITGGSARPVGTQGSCNGRIPGPTA